MKSSSKLALSALIAATLALSGCAASTEATQPETPPSSTPTASPTESAASEGPVIPVPDFTRPDPMGADIDKLVAETPRPDIVTVYPEEQIRSGMLFALNWVEQVSTIPAFYQHDRDLTKDILISEPYHKYFYGTLYDDFVNKNTGKITTLPSVKPLEEDIDVPEMDKTDVGGFVWGPPEVQYLTSEDGTDFTINMKVTADQRNHGGESVNIPLLWEVSAYIDNTKDTGWAISYWKWSAKPLES